MHSQLLGVRLISAGEFFTERSKILKSQSDIDPVFQASNVSCQYVCPSASLLPGCHHFVSPCPSLQAGHAQIMDVDAMPYWPCRVLVGC